jgi:ketosteroid isomerase-like protein
MVVAPLGPGPGLLGPVVSLDCAEGYRAMARQAGAAVTSFRVRYQVCDGDRVCSVVDWTMQPVPGTLSAAEVLEIRDGQIVRGELFYDAEELRRAMAQGPAG